MFESYNKESEKDKKLRSVADVLKQFVLAGTLLLGSEIGLRPDRPYEQPENYSFAEVMELLDEEDRELFLKMTKNRVNKPVSIESSIPSKTENVKISEIKKYLTTLPRGWTAGEIKSIKTTTKREDVEAVPFGALAVFYSDSGKIFFDQEAAKTQERGYNIHAISHEIAHGNDFLTDADISWRERHQMYKKLKDRLKSETRFRTHYLAGLEDEYEKGDYGLLPLMREYWAEINAQYMSDPTQLHIDDFELVHRFVMRNDSSYKWRERLGERAKIQGEFSNPHIPKSEK